MQKLKRTASMLLVLIMIFSLLAAVPAAAQTAGEHSDFSAGRESSAQLGETGSLPPDSDAASGASLRGTRGAAPAAVTYVADGAVVSTESTSIGTAVTLPACVDANPDWTFIGWTSERVPSQTLEKPVCYKPDASFPVNEESVTLYALYRHREDGSTVAYRLVTGEPENRAGVYVISSAADSGMYLMTGVEGRTKIDSDRSGSVALADSGAELDEDLLLNVSDSCLFEAAARGNGAYSIQSMGKGSYLAMYGNFLYTFADYAGGSCDWTLTFQSGWAAIKCADGDFPYIAFRADNSSWCSTAQSSPKIRLWRQTTVGPACYWTDPTSEEHQHELSEHAAIPPACGTDGRIAYWECGVCGRIFSDSAAESEITLASTVVPSTGEHVFGAYSSNGNGTHSHTCAVCEKTFTEACDYEAVVTAPTAVKPGFTTHTCGKCGDSYIDSYTDYAEVTFVADGEVLGTEITRLGGSVTLPASVGEIPDWTFIGWTSERVPAQTFERPACYKPGASFPVNDESVTLYALYLHCANNGIVGCRLVTGGPENWEGVYAVTSAADGSLYLMTGVEGGKNIESEQSGFVALADSSTVLDADVLLNVSDSCLFEIKQRESGAYSVQSVSTGSYLVMSDNYLQTLADYDGAVGDWTFASDDGGIAMQCVGASYPYLRFLGSWNTTQSESARVRLWRQTAVGTSCYWTDPSSEDHPHELTAYAAISPTCVANGRIAYWECGICRQIFSDGAGESVIPLASTVIPATGEHTSGEYAAKGDGTHSYTCAVCGESLTEPCVYDAVVTEPTLTEEGFTTYTCTLCGYSFAGDSTPALGTHTVSFSVPRGCVQPDDMVSNFDTGITLPVVTGPDGYRFMGWVDDIYIHEAVRPSAILFGHYTAPEDVTLYALFKYVEGNEGGIRYELVTEDAADWTGNYVITYGRDSDLFLLTGISAGTYQDKNAGGSTSRQAAGVHLANQALTDVGERCVFAVEAQGSYWSIRSLSQNTYLEDADGCLNAVDVYDASGCRWALTPGGGSSVAIRNAADSRNPCVCFHTADEYFWVLAGDREDISMWRETAIGTPVWTTVIGEPDPGTDYTVTFTALDGVAVPAPMTVNSVMGAILPSVEAPDGFRFLGWVTDEYDSTDAKPSKIYTGRYRAKSDLTMHALFTYFEGDGGIGYELVSEDQTDWTGNYVVTCNADPDKTTVLHTISGDTLYEQANNGGAVRFANAGMSLSGGFLTNVDRGFIFRIEPAQDDESGYTIRSLANDIYVGRFASEYEDSPLLYSFETYESAFCRWNFTFGSQGTGNNVLIKNVYDPDFYEGCPYLGCGYYFGTTYPYFWVNDVTENSGHDVLNMYLWKETETGTRYWTTVLPEPEPPAPTFESHNLLLSGQIGVTFFMDLSPLTADELAECGMAFEIHGAGSVTPGNTAPLSTNMSENGKWYGFTCYVNSIQMADEITATLTYRDGKTVSDTFAVVDYIDAAEELLEKNPDTFDETTVCLIRALADYGYYAQQYFTALRNLSPGDDFTPMDTYYTTEYPIEEFEEFRSMVSEFNVSTTLDAVVGVVSFSLTLDSETALNLTFRPAGSTFSGTLSAEVEDENGNAVDAAVTGNAGRYRVSIPGIRASRLASEYTVRVFLDGEQIAEVSLCALAYANVVLNSGADDDALNLMAALCSYWTAASNWIGAHA